MVHQVEVLRYFEVDLQTLGLKEGGATTQYRRVEGIHSVVYITRGKEGMPLPLGCSSIAVPTDVRSPDGYWFAGLFRLPKSIAQMDVRKLIACIADFWPRLMQSGMIISSIAKNCFQVCELNGNYQLYIPECVLCYSLMQQILTTLREELAGLLPKNKRFRHALLDVSNSCDLIKHPVKQM